MLKWLLSSWVLQSFNKTIVECKGFYQCVNCNVKFRFNKTIVECKEEKISMTEIMSVCFNKTIVECKVIPPPV